MKIFDFRRISVFPRQRGVENGNRVEFTSRSVEYLRLALEDAERENAKLNEEDPW